MELIGPLEDIGVFFLAPVASLVLVLVLILVLILVVYCCCCNIENADAAAGRDDNTAAVAPAAIVEK